MCSFPVKASNFGFTWIYRKKLDISAVICQQSFTEYVERQQ